MELVDDARFLSGLLGTSILLAAVGLTATCGFKVGLERALRIGCIGALATPLVACLAGFVISLLGWLLTANVLAAANGALLALLVLNIGARELSPESERPELSRGRSAFWFLSASTVAAQVATHWLPLYLLVIPLVYLAVACYLDLEEPVPLFVTAGLPAWAAHLGREAVALAFVLAHLAWMFAHELPAPPLLTFVALLGALLMPWAVAEVLDRWIGESRTAFYLAAQLILLGSAVANFPAALYGFLPTAALGLCLTGHADPAWLLPTTAVTLASAFTIGYLLHRRIAAAQNGAHASAG